MDKDYPSKTVRWPMKCPIVYDNMYFLCYALSTSDGLGSDFPGMGQVMHFL